VTSNQMKILTSATYVQLLPGEGKGDSGRGKEGENPGNHCTSPPREREGYQEKKRTSDQSPPLNLLQEKKRKRRKRGSTFTILQYAREGGGAESHVELVDSVFTLPKGGRGNSSHYGKSGEPGRSI